MSKTLNHISAISFVAIVTLLTSGCGGGNVGPLSGIIGTGGTGITASGSTAASSAGDIAATAPCVYQDGSACFTSTSSAVDIAGGNSGFAGANGGSRLLFPPVVSLPAVNTLRGVAAVGAPIVGGAIEVICSAGSPLTTTTDSTTGTWTVTLSGQTQPCAVQVSGGTINGAANTLRYHSIATFAGATVNATAGVTVNVTPLTDLVVANLVGSATPDVWFAGLRTTPTSLTTIGYNQVDTAVGKLDVALDGLPLRNNHPIGALFTPTSGDVSDDMLIALAEAMNNTGISYASLLNSAATPAFVAPAGFGQALTTAYKQTASGSGTTYAIGGTVSGLASTMVLQTYISGPGGLWNVKSDKLAINANGAFSFPAPAGTRYNVSVLTQPVGQTCLVTAGLGQVLGNKTDMMVNCTAYTGLPAGYVVQGGLTWMPVTSSRMLTWTDANAYCTGTAINGQTGWRLPTQPELNVLFFSGATDGQGWTFAFTWSSTPADVGSHYAVTRDAFGQLNSPSLDTLMAYVTCVR